MNATGKDKRKARRNRRIRNVIIILLILAIALTALVIWAQRRVAHSFGTTSDVQSAEVTSGSISSTVSGSGTLTSADVEEVTYPSSVTLDTIYVAEGDTITEGDLLASINSASLLSALSDAQAALDELDEQIEEASEDEVSSTVTSALSGRVKKIYAEADDDVATVMYENGALLLLSLDGYMAVSIDAGALSVGDSVTVTTSDGTEYTGSVESVAASAVILITDNGPEIDDTVTVTDADGNELGSGTLYIHEELKITGYAGTIAKVKTSENTKISSGATLFTLTDTSYSANYDALLQQRESLEETLQTLIALYREGAIYATASGVVESVSGTSATSAYQMSGMTSDSSSETTLLSIAPDTTMTISVSVDETDILSLEEGQTASVTIDSIGTDSFTGTVTEIDTTATSSGGVTQYIAVITIDKTEGMLSGMSASVTITIEGVDNALLLPEDAVTKTSSTAYVYTSYDETTGELGGMTEVTVGLSNGSYIEITDGLSEGDTVYYSTSTDSTSSLFGGMDAAMNIGGDMDISSIGGGSDFSGGMSNDMGGASMGTASMGGATMGGAPN